MLTDRVCLTITDGDSGSRLDQFAAAHLAGVSRAAVQRLAAVAESEPGGIWVNGRRERSSYRLHTGDRVEIDVCAPSVSTAQPESIPIEVVFEDDFLMVVNKPRGMVTHPAPGAPSGTLVNALLGRMAQLAPRGGAIRPGIVHRLDRFTSGLLVTAKTDSTLAALQQQLAERSVKRQYWAVVWGSPRWERATVDAPIGRHKSHPEKMAVLAAAANGARASRTHLNVVERYRGCCSLLDAELESGRTHQIRVHCEYANHPVVGDPLYGGMRKLPSTINSAAKRAPVERAISELGGQALHAFRLRFRHPVDGTELQFEVPMPPVMQALVDALRQL
ncbi:MAG: RluA family pseudouridine synthase [Armatimonadetes bacterium]|nr:RluA family pseudouridine synthase [Armatimonadota bacterium]MDE2206655.1 RluA family pseudouridine synthase [Armatimonadota bacterium]